MIKFYTLPVPDEMRIYNGETGVRAWNDATYSDGLPADWKTNNTEENIKKILQAPSSKFAFADKSAQTSYGLYVSDDSTEVMVVLKGLHQYKAASVSAGESAHITVAWFTHLYHMNVGLKGTPSGVLGVASLGVKSVTEGKTAVSSGATGWSVAGKGKRK